jgi:hypothetical protein
MAQGDKSLRESLPLASADYSDILESLTDYMREQDELSDFDFDGSTAKVVLRLLAYNSHMNALLMNMQHNEAFLSTAVRRDSVIKRARDMGYVPRSTRSSGASVRVVLTPTNPAATELTIPKYHEFTASDGVNSFTFYTTQTTVVVADFNGNFTADLDIVEGKVFDHQYTVDASNAGKFTIPNQLVDTRLIDVQVVEVGTTTPKPYLQKQEITELTSSDRVYWVFETENSLHEIEFGDDSIGRAIQPGAIANVTYFVSKGPDSNGIALFESSAPSGADAIAITTIEPSRGGAKIESIESIKYSAPRYFAQQGRAIIEEDFAAILKNEYTNIDDISVWGGETNNPPRYGIVFIAIKPEVGLVLSTAEKDRVVNDILADRYSALSITPVIIDPEYLYAKLSVEVDYNPAATTNDSLAIGQIVKDATLNYFDSTVSKFKEGFRHSVYLRNVDSSEPSIISSNAVLSLQKRHYPPADFSAHDIEFSLSTKIKNGTFNSSLFGYEGFNRCKFVQNSTSPSVIDLVRFSEADDRFITLLSSVGTIDPNSGSVFIQNFKIESIPDVPSNIDEFGNLFVSFDGSPEDEDFISEFKEILLTEDRCISVIATAV